MNTRQRQRQRSAPRSTTREARGRWSPGRSSGRRRSRPRALPRTAACGRRLVERWRPSACIATRRRERRPHHAQPARRRLGAAHPPRSPSSATAAGRAIAADDRRVDQDRRGEADAELLDLDAAAASAKIANTATITSAALVTVPAGGGDALGGRLARRAPGAARLADPLEHEDRVVHREPEQDHEREQRQPVGDRAVS